MFKKKPAAKNHNECPNSVYKMGSHTLAPLTPRIVDGYQLHVCTGCGQLRVTYHSTYMTYGTKAFESSYDPNEDPT